MKCVNSVLLDEFQTISKELDLRNDKLERVTKISRDITIASKRLIFLIQKAQIQTSPQEKASCLEKAQKAVLKIRVDFFQKLAKELVNESHYYFNRAYTFGLQEFIEAVLFLDYIEKKSLLSHAELAETLNFDITDSRKPKEETSSSLDTCKSQQQQPGCEDIQKQTTASPNLKTEDNSIKDTSQIKSIIGVNVSQNDYLLGIMDFTGELMRSVINARPDDHQAYITDTCSILRLIYQGYIGMNIYARKELSRKIPVLFSSVLKVETFVYELKIRDGDTCGGSILKSDISERDGGIYLLEQDMEYSKNY